MTQPVRVVVLGAGVLGAATAAALARRGAAVTVLTDSAPASGASGRSLAWLNSAGERSPAYHRLRMAGLARYRALARRPETQQWLRFSGAATWAAPGDTLQPRHEHETAIGYESVRLSADDLAQAVPGVARDAIPEEGGILNPSEGWVDLPSLIGLLLAEVTALGGVVRTGTGAASPRLVGGRVVGATTADGREVPADHVVLATGPAVPGELARFGIPLPDATPIALLVRTAPADTGLRTVLNTPRVSIRPAPDGGLVFDSGWSEQAVRRQPDGGYAAAPGTVERLVAEARAVLDGHPPLRVLDVAMGPKPIPADGEPVVGTVDGIDGLSVLFTHSGATLGLVLGALTADEILDGRPSELLAPFRLARFRAERRGAARPGA